MKNSYRSSALFCAELAHTCSMWDWGQISVFGMMYMLTSSKVAISLVNFEYCIKEKNNPSWFLVFVQLNQESYQGLAMLSYLVRFSFKFTALPNNYRVLYHSLFVFLFSRKHNLYAIFIVFKNIFVIFFVDKWGCK